MRISPRRLRTAVLFALDLVLALAAVGGGLALALGLEGARFPTSWLAGTPFDDYVVPGLLLAVTVGGSAVAATVAMLRDVTRGARLSMVAGGVLVAWIVGEIIVLTGDGEVVSPTEVAFLLLGGAMIALGWMLARPAPGPGS